MRLLFKYCNKSVFFIFIISLVLSSVGYYKYFYLLLSQKQLEIKKPSRTKPTLDVEQKFYLFPMELLSEFEETRYTIPMREQIKRKNKNTAKDISKSILKMRNQTIIQSELESFAN